MRLRVATRGSALARWQAADVARRLGEAHPALDVEMVVLDATGDRHPDVAVWEMGGQGVFVKEVQAAVLDGRADVAVHSAKDLPSLTGAGLSLAAVPVRADARDALVGVTLEQLAPGATVATGSVRRRAQLAWVRPDLSFTGLRGSIATRLDRVPPGGVMVVAVAALERLGLLDRVAQVLGEDLMVPQVAQGAIGVECRAADVATAALLQAIDDPVARAEVEAERAYLARLGGGCDLPVGARAHLEADGSLTVEGMLASLDGRVVLRGARSGRAEERATLGRELAEDLLAAGGAEVLGAGGGPAGTP